MTFHAAEHCDPINATNRNNMPTAVRNIARARTVEEARAANELSTVIRVNRVPISAFGAIGKLPGPAGNNAPLSSITYTMENTSGGVLTYVLGDGEGLVAGALGATWTQPTRVKNGSVSAVQESYSNIPVMVQGLNYIVSNASQYSEALMYVGADRDGRFSGQPIDIDAILRNNQEIATRQTIMFDQPYLLDGLHGFTVRVLDGVSVTMSLLLAANAA